jgi:PAS domain S-box-containing protein
VKDYAIIILDPDGYVSTWNAGAERIQGYTAQEIIGQHFSVLYPPAVVAAGKCEAELEIARREGRFEEEGFRLRKDGSQIWANVAITPLRDAQGTLVGFAKVTQDLTARRAAEEEARRFRLLVQSVKDYAIFILDPNGIVTTWNPGAQRIKGFTAEQIIGRHFSSFYPEEVRYSGKCEAELEIAAREGRFEEEGFRLRQDGSLFWANVIITALRDPSGTLIGFAKVTQDLTSRKEAEENQRALAAQRAALAEKARIQEFQERFLAILGHDLRNPLAAIDMGTALLSQQVTEPAARRVLERMRSSSSRMTRMITQILDLTRSRLAGGLEMIRAPMDLSATLLEIAEEMRAAFPGHTILVNAPKIMGSWDRDRLEQVFSNLIGNALLHGAANQPVTVQASQGANEVQVTVHNYGEPISPEAQVTLFSAFRRGERESRTAKTAGLGLGLFISHEIVRGHGGSISVESDAEHGTTFRLTLPLSDATGE